MLVRNENERPYVASSIVDLVIDEDSVDMFLDLRAVFEDNEDADSELVYTIENVTNSGIFDAVTVTASDYFALDFSEHQNGGSVVTIRATDTGGLFVDATANITINPVNDDPFVIGPVSTIVVDEDSTDVLINLDGVFDDVDILTNSDFLNYSVVSNTNGALISTSLVGQQLTLDFTDDQFGSGVITVRASDSFGRSAEESIEVTVDSVNDDPEVSNVVSRLRSEEDSFFMVDLLEGASDRDLGDFLAVTNLVLVGGDNRGVSIVGSNLNVDPDRYGDLGSGETETLVYEYLIVDSNGGSVEQTATIVIAGVNDAPILVSPIGQIDANEDDLVAAIPLTNVFADIDDQTLAYRIVSTNGTWLARADIVGSGLVLAYQANQFGLAEIVIEASDISGRVATDTITLNVLPVNDRPEVVDQVFSPARSGRAGSTRLITGNVLAGAVDVENDVLTVNLVEAPGNGVIDLNPDGNFTFTPDATFVGAVTFQFEASDGVDVSNIGTATIITDQFLPSNSSETSSDDSEDDDDQLVPVTLQQLPVAKVKEAAEVEAGMPAMLASFQSRIPFSQSDETFLVLNSGAEVRGGSAGRQYFALVSDAFVRTSIDAVTNHSFDYSSEFSDSLTAFGRDLDEAERNLEFSQLSTVVSISGVSIGFMSLVLRTGALVASMMVNVPAWRVMDPLYVLGYSDDDAIDEDESLLDIVESENIGSTCKVPATQSRQGVVRSRLTPLRNACPHA